MIPKKKTTKKIKPFTTAWCKIAAYVASNYAPQIFPCKECGYPVADGYCCGNCGSAEPGNPDDWGDIWMGEV